MKRPIVIEFSGLPNSGKTTLMQNLKVLSERNNISTIIMQEPAELVPTIIHKGSITQNLWITLETLQRSLELCYVEDKDFILLDRGYYNQLFWTKMYEEKDPQYVEYVTNFMKALEKKFNIKPDYLYVVDVEVEESIRRRESERAEPVTFSKIGFLTEYKRKFEEFYSAIDSRFYIDTTGLTKSQVADMVFKQIILL